jgi:hypothetical protein
VPDVDVTGVNRRVDRATMARIEAIDTHFGHAGPAFVQALIDAGLHRDSAARHAEIMELAGRLAGPKADSLHARAALPFAVLAMAGGLATQFGLIPGTVDVSRFVKWAWERFSRSTDAAALDPETQAVTNLRAWIAERWDSSIHPTDPPTSTFGVERKPVRDALGWYDDTAVYLPAHRLREAAGGTLKEMEIAKALNAQGLIAKRHETGCFYVSYVPKVGKVKAYALSRSGFGRTGKNDDPEAFKVHQGGRL